MSLRINLLLALVAINIGMTGYLLYSLNGRTPVTSEAKLPSEDQVSKEEAMALAQRIVQRYNEQDVDGLYAQFSDVARVQFPKEKLTESMAKLHSVVGRVDEYAYTHTAAAGSQDGKEFRTIHYRVRLSGGAMPTGEMKITVAQEGQSLALYGFFLNGMQQ